MASYAGEEDLAYFQRGLVVKGTSPENTEPVGDADEAELLFGLGRAQLATLPFIRLPEALFCLERSFEYYDNAKDETNANRVAEYPLPRTVGGRSKVEARIERGLTLVPSDSVAAGRLLSIDGLELEAASNATKPGLKKPLSVPWR